MLDGFFICFILINYEYFGKKFAIFLIHHSLKIDICSYKWFDKSNPTFLTKKLIAFINFEIKLMHTSIVFQAYLFYYFINPWSIHSNFPLSLKFTEFGYAPNIWAAASVYKIFFFWDAKLFSFVEKSLITIVVIFTI